MRRLGLSIALGLGLVGLSAGAAFAAMCFTTDDGQYPCAFQQIEGDGSFVISADDKPTFTLYVIGPDVGDASAVFEPGGRSVPLPGPYIRSEIDGACWVSVATGTKICAW